MTHLLDFYYGVTWNVVRKNLFRWKDAENANFEKKVKDFFEPKRILDLIHHYIVFVRKDDTLEKVILRQHQTRAVGKVVDRALDKEKRRGLIWHTQGSGKTYTMITAASLLLRVPELEKPTIIMLVDRNELEAQMFNNLERYGFGCVEVAQTKAHLQKLLKSDYRGLLVSMIHKFEKIPAGINKRSNIVVLVDEAHRTTTGDLGNYLFAALPNATYIGFTGTPIDKIAYGKGTFKVFGCDDPQGYLDKYSIRESIEDGTTVPLHYSLAPNEMLVDKELLRKEFLELAETQGITDIEELNKVLERAVNLRNFLKAKDRVEKVAKFVADHYRLNVEPMGYKAFLVAVDREACVLYKEALDHHLPPDWSAVVYSPAHNDPPKLKRFHRTEAEEKQVRKAFVRKDSLPKILIVTEKLLTGFDAPILYAMYLDKPMRDHALLQAIARVNRPHEDEESGQKKKCGFILDFVGIFENLQKALAFDSDEVDSVIQDIALLKRLFAEMMTGKAQEYLKLVRPNVNDKTVEAALEHFCDKERREEFYKFYRELESLYEIISPDAFLSPYIEDYRLLSKLFKIIRNAFTRPGVVDRDFLRKTAELVREKVGADGLDRVLPACAFNEHLLEELKKRHSSEVVQVINLVRAIQDHIMKHGAEEPYLLDIGEQAEAIRQQFENRQRSTQEALAELSRIVKTIQEAKAIRESKGLDIGSFTTYWVLKEQGLDGHEALSRDVSKCFEEHPNWNCNAEERRTLKTTLYRMLMQTPLGDKMVDVVERLLKLHTELRRQSDR